MNKDLQSFTKQLGENIARIRMGKGITQTDLADEIEMDRANLRRIEAGRSIPATSTLFRIGKALKVEIKDFFDFSLLQSSLGNKPDSSEGKEKRGH